MCSGEGQTFQGNAVGEEEYGKSAEAVQNELSLLPGCCFWEGREREKKKKKEGRIWRLWRALAGAGTQPQPWMKQKGKHRAKPRLKNEQ